MQLFYKFHVNKTPCRRSLVLYSIGEWVAESPMVTDAEMLPAGKLCVMQIV